MEQRWEDNVMAAVLLVVMGAAFVWSLSYGPATRALPELVSGVSVAALIAHLVTANLSGFRMKSASDAIVATHVPFRDGARPQAPTEVPRQKPAGSVWVGLTLPLLYLATYIVLGIVPAVFLFIAGYAWRYGRVPWYKAVPAGALVALFVYFLSLFVFRYPMYGGLVTRWL